MSLIRLDEIAKINYGKNLPTKNLTKDGYPVFGANGQIGFYSKYLYKDEQLLISCRGAYSGKINFSLKQSFVTNNSLIVDFPIHEKELRKFYYYILQGANKNRLVTGTAQPQVTINNAIELKIPLPPLLEQKAIVAKIEQLFSELDKGIESLKTAQAKLKIYRQAVLKKAFDEIDATIYKIPDVLHKVQIGPFGSQLHKSDYITDGIPLINPMHIKNGKIVADFSYSIAIEKRDSLPNYILRTGDVIMGRRGEMGRCGLVTEHESGWFCGTGSLYFRPKLDILYPLYLYYYLSSATIKELLTGKASGTTMDNLNKKIIYTLPIPLPDFNIQNQIVQEIESRLSVCDNIEKTISDALVKAEALRQSILKKAFEGKLLDAKELEAIKSHPEYESAEKLLQRIKLERAK